MQFAWSTQKKEINCIFISVLVTAYERVGEFTCNLFLWINYLYIYINGERERKLNYFIIQ